MQDLIVSLNGNVLKATTLIKGEFNAVVKDVPKDVVEDSRILDESAFAAILKEAVAELAVATKAKFKLTLVLEPEDVIFKFITVNKAGEDLEAKIVDEIQSKLEGIALDSLYFSYIKIAPFVYQFVGIKKEYLDKYLSIATSIGIPLYSVIPCVLLLPKSPGLVVS